MKKFFEKHSLGKSLGILFLGSLILTWIIPAGSFNGGEYVETGLVRLGLSDAGNIIYYMLAMSIDKILFLLTLGVFYGILNKIPAYDNLIGKIAKGLKGKEVISAVLTSMFITILSSMTTSTFAVLVFVPFIIDVILEMKLDNITALVVTFGSMLVGSLGATLGSDGLIWFNYYISNQSAFNIAEIDTLYRVLVLVVAILLFNFFTIVHVKNIISKNLSLETKESKVKNEKLNKQQSVKKENKKIKLVYKKCLLITLGIMLAIAVISTSALLKLGFGFAFMLGIIISLSVLTTVSYYIIYKKACGKGWKYLIPFYNIYTLLKITELPLWYIILYLIPFANVYVLIKANIKLARGFGKGTGFGVLLSIIPMVTAPLIAFADNNYKLSNKSLIKEDDIDDKKCTALIVILAISSVLTILGIINWSGNFGIELFNNFHEWLVNLTIGEDFTLLYYILGSSLAPFGNQTETYPTWNLYSLISLLVIAAITLIIVYGFNFNKIYDAAIDGLKKFGKVAFAVFCAYSVYIIFYFSPMMATITNKLMPVEGKPDINIDYNGSGMAFFNLDNDGDLKADENLINQDTNKDGKCDLNCDSDGDGYPDQYLDFDGNKEIGDSDKELLETFVATSTLNYDSDQDGYADVNIDTDYNVGSNILSAFVTSIFHNDLMYTGYTLSGYMISGFSAYLNIISMIYITMFGFVAFLAPTSILLVAGLTYTNVEYKKWLSYIWKFAVGMLLSLIIIYILLYLL